jgi:hypothetical protein
MKQIQPVSIWYNGQIMSATIFNMISISDDLSTNAVFYFQLLTASNLQLTDGNITMDGFDYQAYSTSPDSNSYAYSWGVSKLNLTLV